MAMIKQNLPLMMSIMMMMSMMMVDGLMVMKISMAMTINSMFKHCKYVHHDDENNVCFVHERLGEEKMPSVRKLLQTFPATCHLLAVTTIASAFVFCILMMMMIMMKMIMIMMKIKMMKIILDHHQVVRPAEHKTRRGETSKAASSSPPCFASSKK